MSTANDDPDHREFLLDQYTEWMRRSGQDQEPSEAADLITGLYRFALLHPQTTLVNALFRLTTEASAQSD